MKAYIKNDGQDFLYPDQMEKILDYLKSHGTLQVSAEQVEGYYIMFSEEHCAGWLIVNDMCLTEFADFLADIDVNPAHCQGDACDL